MQLRLNSLQNCRRSLASVIRRRMKGELDREEYRDVVHGLHRLLGYWRLESEIRIEDKLDQVIAEIEGNR